MKHKIKDFFPRPELKLGWGILDILILIVLHKYSILRYVRCSTATFIQLYVYIQLYAIRVCWMSCTVLVLCRLVGGAYRYMCYSIVAHVHVYSIEYTVVYY